MSATENSSSNLYIALTKKLEDMGLRISPAETHGVVLGMLCAQPKDLDTENLNTVLLELNEDNAKDDKAFRQFLESMLDQAKEMLFSQGFDIQLLVPQEDGPLKERIEALSNWCQGYVYGLVAGGVRDFDHLPDDASEIIEDILQISKLGADSENYDDEEEKAFFEIEQFVRVGVQLVFEEMHTPEAKPQDQS